MVIAFMVLAAILGIVAAAIWATLRKSRLAVKSAVVWAGASVAIALLSVGALSSLAPKPSPTQSPAQAQAAAPASAAAGMESLNRSLAKRQASSTRLEFVAVEGDKYRLYLVYITPPTSMPEVERDSIAAVRAAMDALSENGVDPWSGGTFISVYAQRPDGSAGGRQLIRRYGNATFSAITGKFDFSPAR